MSFLDSLVRSLFGAQQDRNGYVPTRNEYPQQNYDQYSNLPGLPMGTPNAYHPDPHRLHAPFRKRWLWFWIVDEADPAVLRTPDLPSQQYFNQVEELPRTPAYVPAHGLRVPQHAYYVGHNNAFLPDSPSRMPIQASAPPVFLSRPIRVNTIVATTPERKPLVNARAPKPKRSHNK